MIREEDDNWNLRALRCICQERPDLAGVVNARAQAEAGILKAALLSCVHPNDPDLVMTALRELLEADTTRRGKEPVHLLSEIELNWTGNECFLVELLHLRDSCLADALLDPIYNEHECIGECEIGPCKWWLDWLRQLTVTDDWEWFGYKLAWFLSRATTAQSKDMFLAEFNDAGSPFRDLLAESVLPHFPDLTTDAFSEEATSFLFAHLGRKGSRRMFHGHLLGATATERFVDERLLPLVTSAKSPFSGRLRNVLIEAGRRHGKRYVRT